MINSAGAANGTLAVAVSTKKVAISTESFLSVKYQEIRDYRIKRRAAPAAYRMCQQSRSHMQLHVHVHVHTHTVAESAYGEFSLLFLLVCPRDARRRGSKGLPHSNFRVSDSPLHPRGDDTACVRTERTSAIGLIPRYRFEPLVRLIANHAGRAARRSFVLRRDEPSNFLFACDRSILLLVRLFTPAHLWYRYFLSRLPTRALRERVSPFQYRDFFGRLEIDPR